MSPLKINVSPLLLLAVFIIVTTFSMDMKAANGVEIHVYNYVNEGKITVICATTGRKFPAYDIVYKSGKYHVSADTLPISCDFQFQGKSHSFGIFDPERDKCSNCVWWIREVGPCFQDSLAGGELCYPWNN